MQTLSVWQKIIHLTYVFGLAACGEAPEPWDSNAGTPSSTVGGATQSTASPSEIKESDAETPEASQGLPQDIPAKVAENPAMPVAPKPPVTPPAPTTPPPANNAALIQQGTTVYNAKCAGCHAPLAQKANDVRINAKTAAQLSAAATRPQHGGVTWPLAADIAALEAVLK